MDFGTGQAGMTDTAFDTLAVTRLLRAGSDAIVDAGRTEDVQGQTIIGIRQGKPGD